MIASGGGRADAPVTLDFETWGEPGAPPALVDLSEPLAGLGAGAPVGGAAVLAADFPASVPRARWPDTLMIQQDGRLMGLAQLPTPADFARTSDLAEWFDYDVYENAGSRETGWREWITAPAAFAAISGPKAGLLLRVWGWGNRTAIYQVADHDPATGRAEIVPYLHDRPVVPREDTQPVKRKLAIINHPDCLRAEGQYLVDPAISKLTLRPFGGAASGSAVRRRRGGRCVGDRDPRAARDALGRAGADGGERRAAERRHPGAVRGRRRPRGPDRCAAAMSTTAWSRGRGSICTAGAGRSRGR